MRWDCLSAIRRPDTRSADGYMACALCVSAPIGSPISSQKTNAQSEWQRSDIAQSHTAPTRGDGPTVDLCRTETLALVPVSYRKSAADVVARLDPMSPSADHLDLRL